MIRQELNVQAKGIEQLHKMREEDATRLPHQIAKVVDVRLAEMRAERTGILTLTGEETAKEIKFFQARKSMLIWPISECADLAAAIRTFMEKRLNMPASTIRSIEFEHIERVHQARRSRIKDEVMVRFSNTAERDITQSYAANLASQGGTAGIRMVIPEHLRGLFKLFEVHGGKMREKFGPNFKRSIKFDDPTQALIMDIKMPDELKWIRLHREDIVVISRERNNRESVVQLAKTDDQRGHLMRKVLLRSPVKTTRAHIHTEVVSEDSDGDVDLSGGYQNLGQQTGACA